MIFSTECGRMMIQNSLSLLKCVKTLALFLEKKWMINTKSWTVIQFVRIVQIVFSLCPNVHASLFGQYGIQRDVDTLCKL